MSKPFWVAEFQATPHRLLVILLILMLGGCQTGSYMENCLKAGGLAGLVGAGWQFAKGKSAGKAVKTGVFAFAGGCAIGLAATAIGKALNEKEREKHDAAFQKASQSGADRLAEEQRRIDAEYQSMEPATDEASKAKRQQEQKIAKRSVTFSTPVKETWESDPGEPPAQGKVLVVGTSPSEADASETGKDCLEVREWVLKDGKEIPQTSKACQDENGKWVRVVT